MTTKQGVQVNNLSTQYHHYQKPQGQHNKKNSFDEAHLIPNLRNPPTPSSLQPNPLFRQTVILGTSSIKPQSQGASIQLSGQATPQITQKSGQATPIISQQTSNSSSRRQTPERRSGMTPSLKNKNMPQQMMILNEQFTQGEENDEPAAINFKRKMKLSLIRNVYQKRQPSSINTPSSSINNNRQPTSTNNSSNNNYIPIHNQQDISIDNHHGRTMYGQNSPFGKRLSQNSQHQQPSQQQQDRVNRSVNVSLNNSIAEWKDPMMTSGKRGRGEINSVHETYQQSQPPTISLYRRHSPFDLNKILPQSTNNCNSTHNNSLKDSNSLLTSTNLNSSTVTDVTVSIAAAKRTPAISKAYTYNPKKSINSASISIAEKEDYSLQLLQKGQKLFKENDIQGAIKCFSEASKNEGDSLELQYMLGVCYLGQCEYDKAIKELTQVIKKDPQYRKNAYIMASVAMRKQGNLEQAEKILSDGIELYGDFYECLVARGRVRVKRREMTTGLADFEKAISIDESRGEAHFAKGDALKALGEGKKAIEEYEKGFKGPNTQMKAIIKMASAMISLQMYEEALQKLKEMGGEEEKNSEALLVKGLAEKGNKQISDASLSFEAAVQKNDSLKATRKALEEIAIMKIEKRDFYQALHTLQRVEYLEEVEIKQKKQQTSQLQKRDKDQSNIFTNKKKDQSRLERLRILTESVILLMKRKFEEGVDKFSTMENDLDEFTFPLFYSYRAYGFFCLGRHSEAIIDYRKLKQSQQQSKDISIRYNECLCNGIINVKDNRFESGIKYFHQAMKLYNNKVEPYLYQSAAQLQLAFNGSSASQSQPQQILTNYVASALDSLNIASNLKECPASVFYFRSVIKSYLGLFREATSDIDKAIEKSEDNVPAYFFLRGIAFACLGHFKQAISDLSIVVQLDDQFADAYLERAKCCHFAGDSSNAFADLQKYISLKPTDPRIHELAGNLLFNNAAYDDAIRAYSHSDQINQSEVLLSLRAQCYVLLRDLPSAYKDLTKVIELSPSRRMQFDRGCIGGLLIVLQSLESLSSQEKGLLKALSHFEKLQQSQCKQGYMFKSYDLQLIMGVLKLLCGAHLDAIAHFQTAVEYRSQNSASQKNMQLEQQDNYDEDEQLEKQKYLCQKFLSQAYYNMAIANIIGGRLNEANECNQKVLRIESQLKSKQDSSQSEQLQQLEEEQNKGDMLQELIQNEKHQQQQQLLQQKDSISAEVVYDKWEALTNVVQDNNLSEQLPYLQTLITKTKVKVMLDVPVINPPNFQPTFNIQLLENIKVDSVENKPEAPWIKRNESGVVFTDNLQQFNDDDLDDDDENNKQKDDKDRIIEIDRMKAKLMLDKDVEDKLKNIKKIKKINNNNALKGKDENKKQQHDINQPPSSDQKQDKVVVNA